MERITVLFGNYGSGKTELAINLALRAAEAGQDTALVDLDIVNPYFRSSEHETMLEGYGVRVVRPAYANTAVDLPTLPRELYSVFSGGRVVFDCGGDAVGAAALGSLKPRFDTVRGQTRALFVVNTTRPFQGSAEEIAKSLQTVQASARLQADGFVLNTNLGAQSTGRELADAYPVALALSRKTGLKLAAVSGTAQALEIFKERCGDYTGETICIDIHTRPAWMENS